MSKTILIGLALLLAAMFANDQIRCGEMFGHRICIVKMDWFN